MVEETDKGLFVTYAPETKLSQSSMNKRAAEEDIIGRKESKVMDEAKVLKFKLMQSRR